MTLGGSIHISLTLSVDERRDIAKEREGGIRLIANCKRILS